MRAGEEKQTAQRKRREKWRNKMVVVLSIDEQLQISRRLYPIPHLSIFVMRAIKFRRIGYPLSLGRSESLRNLRAWVKSSRLSLSLSPPVVCLIISFGHDDVHSGSSM